MGEVRALKPRQDAPAARALSTAETWDVLLTGLRAAHATMGETIASIEAGAPSADIFPLIGRLDAQLAPVGPLALALYGDEHPAGAA
ncbi:hypothetical protein CIW48_23585 [Methylobacterium sp. P1-11]|uniref:hypothetical protein n=1 Tax=Methylobacterium sp. P1-11 TaxID=2024616 RepID=UPI0011ECBCB1|nr:hypothetical protein [Methylobacterium sp. P1-11]KAA0121392.1 hypothetical protein CIW48_23585 [Methylobacterium sp. P1-11]